MNDQRSRDHRWRGRRSTNTASNGLDAPRDVDVDVRERADPDLLACVAMWSGTAKRLGEVASGLRLLDGTGGTVA